MAKVLSTSTNVGGMSATAKAGSGYNQGGQFAAEGGYTGGVGSHKDLRGGTAVASTGYNQGNQIAASSGSGGVPGSSMGRASETGGKHSAKEAAGYNQGFQSSAKKK